MALSEQLDASGRRLVQRWAAEPEAVSTIRATVRRFATDVGARPRTVDDVALAVSEAATNAVVHAFIDGVPRGSVTVTAAVRDTDLWLEVLDDGTGMRPRTDSPGAGLGLPIISHLATEVRIEDARACGTCVKMRFLLAPEA